MFCYMCGTKLNDGDAFCTNCGARQEEEVLQQEPAAVIAEEPIPESVPETPVAETVVENTPAVAVAAPGAAAVEAPVIPQNAVMVTDWKNSYFDGSTWGLIGVSLLTAFVSAITLGLAAPGLICFRLRWFYKHTCIGGYRLKFTGRGWPLFGKILLWTLLTIITVGIFTLWIPVKFKKWEIKHVEIDSVLAPNMVK